MTYTYTSATLVAAELRATAAFSSSTVPTADQVATWIGEESADINTKAGRVFGSTAYTEDIDYDGAETITLVNAPIISVTSLLYSTSGLGTATYALDQTAVENTDFTVYKDEGEIVRLPNWNNVSTGRKTIQVTYTAGHTNTPLDVQKLATKKVAKRVIDSLLTKDINEKKSGKSISVGSISIVKPSDFGVSQYRALGEDIATLEANLTKGSGVYRLNVNRF